MEKENLLLRQLYESKWIEISNMLQIFNEQEPDDTANYATNPLLIKTNEEYINSDLKIMFFGQETNFWGREFNNGAFEEGIEIDTLLSLYDEFYLSKGYKTHGKPFWNFISRLRRQDYHKKSGYIWNNVLKIGKSDIGTPQNELINYTFRYFDVERQEIEILKPNILLFLSGYKYDQYIKRSLGDFTVIPINGFHINEFCIINFNNLNIDLALRTYHPGYLQRLGNKRMDEVTEKIIEIIKLIK